MFYFSALLLFLTSLPIFPTQMCETQASSMIQKKKTLWPTHGSHGSTQLDRCSQYDGILHPNGRTCCKASCGRFCGAADCKDAPQGAESCCSGAISDNSWCTDSQPAPCTIQDVCRQFGGVKDATSYFCCPASCGSYCGGPLCKTKSFDDNCCPSVVETLASCSSHSPPCAIPEPSCAHFCKVSSLRWIDKCDWLECGSCPACNYKYERPTPEPTPQANCKLWCQTNSHHWRSKCSWSECKTCNSCIAFTTTTTTTLPWEESCALEDLPVGKPNVLMLITDDQNADGGGPDAQTPSMDRLGRRGVKFQRAYTDHPICAPSRASFLSGLTGKSSGFFFGRRGDMGGALMIKQYWYENEVLKEVLTIPEFFMSNCYYVVGTGKVNHDELPDKSSGVWHEYYAAADYGPYAFDGIKNQMHPDMPESLRNISGAIDFNFAPLSRVPFNDVDNPKAGWKYGGKKTDCGPKGAFPFFSEEDRGMLPDEYNAAWAVQRIGEFSLHRNGQPWFMAIGFARPHTPLYCPAKYFEDFPLETLQINDNMRTVVDASYYFNVSNEHQKGYELFNALRGAYADPEQGLKLWMQAYYACVKFVDEQIGRVVEALEDSPFWESTIVVMMSDNGWQQGAKQYVYKNSPWEQGSRVPLIIRAPGVAKEGTVVDHPVRLADLYPTLIDLCHLQDRPTMKSTKGKPLEGHSMKRFLEGETSWDGPGFVVSWLYPSYNKIMLPWPDCNTNITCNHFTLRDSNYRYVLYNNGLEEIYEYANDPHELNNIVGTPKGKQLRKQLRQELADYLNVDSTELGVWTTLIPPKPNHCAYWCAKNSLPWLDKCKFEPCKECLDCGDKSVFEGGDETDDKDWHKPKESSKSLANTQGVQATAGSPSTSLEASRTESQGGTQDDWPSGYRVVSTENVGCCATEVTIELPAENACRNCQGKARYGKARHLCELCAQQRRRKSRSKKGESQNIQLKTMIHLGERRYDTAFRDDLSDYEYYIA